MGIELVNNTRKTIIRIILSKIKKNSRFKEKHK